MSPSPSAAVFGRAQDDLAFLEAGREIGAARWRGAVIDG